MTVGYYRGAVKRKINFCYNNVFYEMNQCAKSIYGNPGCIISTWPMVTFF